MNITVLYKKRVFPEVCTMYTEFTLNAGIHR